MRMRKNLVTALLAAALCVMAPWAVPVPPIPATLATLGVYLAAGLLGPARGCAAVGVYLALGAVGVPVFAGFTGGFGQLIGPTGGFLWGYLLCALLVGRLSRIGPPVMLPVWIACGTAALYAVGCLWLSWQNNTPFGATLLLCVAVSLTGELAKIVVATALILSLRGRVSRLLTNGIKEQRL